jgi:hypothetical protein
MRIVNKDYLAKVTNLSEENIDGLFKRFRLELVRFFEEQKLSIEEALAIQLEEWRENRIKINEIYKYS